MDARLAELELQLREARKRAREAARVAREAAAERARARQGPRTGRASDEELGYFSTDDSVSKILADAKDELVGRLHQVRGSPPARQAADVIDELGAMLRGERRGKPRDED